MRKYFLIIPFLTVFLNSLFAQQLSSVNEPVFKVGEQLTYTLKYGFFTAAEAVINVEESDRKFDDHPVFHIVADGKTAGTFEDRKSVV